MTRLDQRTTRALGALALAIATGCGGSSQSPPARYGYGDMFENRNDEPGDYGGSYGGGGSPAPSAVTTTVSTESDSDGMAYEMAASGASDDAGESYDVEAERSYDSPPPAPPPPSPVVAATGAPAPQRSPESVSAPTTPRPAPAGPEQGQGAAGHAAPGREPAAAGERRAPMLIYEAALALATRTVREQVDAAVRITHELGGVIVSQDDSGVMVRVPAPRFREALGLFEALGDVVERRVTAQDVSEQVRDTRVRLQNAINLRDRLRELLRQATTVPESLAIERELERLNETIALLQGQLESLEERVAYSTVTIRFQAVQDESVVPNELFRLPFGWLDEIGLPNLLTL